MDDLVKRLRMACVSDCKCSIQEAADTIERLSAEKADFHMAYRIKCDEETKRLEARIAALEAENKALLSGQPVNGWQLVPVKLSESLIEAGAVLRLKRLRCPDENKGILASIQENHDVILTASAQEMALQALATQAQELGMGYDDERKV